MTKKFGYWQKPILYYQLRRRIGKTSALRAATAVEKAIFVFGRGRIGSGT